VEPRPVSYDPDGPIPNVPPTPEAPKWIRGRAPLTQDAHATVREWRELAELDNLSLRQVVAKVFEPRGVRRHPDTGGRRDRPLRQQDVCDGLHPRLARQPVRPDEVVDRVIPLLRERGAFRTEYRGTTLREPRLAR